jgi:hypothetical protein
MTKAKKPITTFKDLPIERTVEFIGLIKPEYGGSRYIQDERNHIWQFVATLVAWQANGGPLLHEELAIRKMDLDNSDAVALVRQTPKGRMIQFTGRRPRRLGTSHNYVKLVGPILKTRERFAVESTVEKPEPKPYTDKIFGRLRFNEESGGFECEKTFGNSKLTIIFETDDLEKLKAMLPVASRHTGITLTDWLTRGGKAKKS